MNRVEVSEHMMWSAVRYSLGRSTYINVDTADELRAVWQDLTAGTRDGIRRDITDWLGQVVARPLNSCDIDTWRRFITWADEQETKP